MIGVAIDAEQAPKETAPPNVEPSNVELLDAAWSAAASVADPEIPTITIEQLGMLRGVRHDDETGEVTVTITPTYSGCPAMDTIRADIRRALAAKGFSLVRVETVLRPAWSTDFISDSGRRALADAGIGTPPRMSAAGPGPDPRQRTALPILPATTSVICPQCGSTTTEEISHFGATACKSLWRCRACAEPFEQVKML